MTDPSAEPSEGQDDPPAPPTTIEASSSASTTASLESPPAADALAQIAEPFTRPVPGARPAGENARYDPRHEAIRNEVDKLNRPSGEAVDWQLVYDQGRSLLTDTSKDFMVASYFAVAAYLCNGPRGLVEGLAALSAMLDRFWDDGFPPPNRIRARVNAIDWFIDRVESHGGTAPSSVRAGDLKLLSAASQQLEAGVMQRFIDEMPNIHGLKAALQPIEIAIAAQTPSETEAAATPPTEQAPPTRPVDPVPQAPQHTPSELEATPPSDSAGSPIAARFAAIASPFASPIPGASRAGENARYDGRHEAARREVDKLGKPTATDLDWQLVEDSGRALLTETSKDFLIASYFAIASFARKGVPGLIEGLAAIVALLREYWDDGFPPPTRVRARINAIDWFIERVAGMSDGVSKQLDPEDVALIALASGELEALVLDRFEEEMPNIHGLKATLKTIERSAAKAVPVPKAPQSSPQTQASTSPSAASSSPAEQAPAQSVSVQLAAPAAQLADPTQVQDYLDKLGESIYQTSRTLYIASKQDPLAYRLCRQGLYMPFIKAPPTTEDRRTTLPPPPDDRRAYLDELLAAQNWGGLLEEAEASLQFFRHWLDLHRYVALALEGLGHAQARDAVVRETVAVIRRLPEMLDLQCRDGLPFVGEATRGWLDAEVPTAPDPEKAGSHAQTGDTAVEESLAAARKLAIGGKLDEALATYTRIVQSEIRVERDRFRAGLAMAEACKTAGSPALAEGILAGLCERVERFQLEEWEPELAERCYRARYEALTAMAIDSVKSRDELADVYRRLCTLAPSTALKLGKPS